MKVRELRRHAFLLLVHGQPELFARLVQALDLDAFDIYVHVDRTVDIEPFARGVGSRVVFTRHRFDVERKCWSMVQATRELLQTAVRAHADYGYLTLLSGADYPLVPVEQLRERLDAGSSELVHYFRIDDRPAWRARVDVRHYRDDAYARDHSRLNAPMRRLDESCRRARRVSHRILSAFGREYAPPDGWTLCGGSQWWSMTSAAARHCLGQLSRREVRNYFRFTDGPDELIFQSILYNSRFSSRFEAADAYVRWADSVSSSMLPEVIFNVRYVDWSVDRHEMPPGGGPLRGPTVLDDRDFDALANSGALFARKFDARRSSGLLDRIDRELRGR